MDIYALKMEYVPKINIFGLTTKVKNQKVLEKDVCFRPRLSRV